MESIAVSADAVWRLFIAIDLTDDVRSVLTRMQERLRRTGAHVSCPLPEHLHITLCFLGHLFAGRLPDVRTAMDVAAAPARPFALEVGGVGAYGRLYHPRVIWAGIRPSPELSALHERLRQALTARGFPSEARSFSPHITLARVRSMRGIEELRSWQSAVRNMHVGRLEVAEIRLYRSETERPRPVYTALHAAALGAK